MEPNELLSVSPEFLAKAIIHRRERLLELIPSELEQAQSLQMEAEQNSRNAKLSRDEINQKVANLKKERNHAQNEAKQLFEQATKARDELIEKGEMKNPEPKWAKDKLSNKIQRIEEKIQTTGGNHKTEEKFINEMKALIKEHEEWVAQRANASPLMNEMKKNQQAAKKLIIAAEKAHKSMVELVEANEDRHTSFVGWEEKRRKHTSLSGKLTTAKRSSEEAVRFWRGTLEKGLEALLIDAKRVEEGGQSTLSLRKENKRSEEE